MTQKHKRLGALLLALALLGQLLLPALAAEGNTVSIATVQDLVRLSEQCVSDRWSEGVTVVLTADLDLEGRPFRPIPVFRGTFDGNGHTISGFVFTEKGSDVGLFRYLQEGAVVRDLTLDVTMTPGGTASGVGALAGRNQGTVEHVTVTGTVSGSEDTGGLVGVNSEGGLLRDCVNRAELTCTTRTGGIAGSNLGVIEGCTNEGAVNTTDNSDMEDTGGIAGLNSGTIRDCTNQGEVGYLHVGYNMGGIAGRQDGEITGCVNRAPVSGRKDVGGIVGQFEPYTRLTYGEDPAEKLDRTMAALFDLLEQLADQVNRLSGDAVNDLEAINTTLSALRDTAHDTGTEGLEDIEATSNRIYDNVQDINRSMGNITVIWDDFSGDAHADLAEFNRQLTRLEGAVDAMLGAVDGGISDACRQMDESVDHLQADSAGIADQIDQMADEIRRLENFLQDIGQALASFDLMGLLNAFDRWSVRSIDLGSHMRKIGQYIEDIGDDLADLWDGLSAAQSEASEALNSARADADLAAAALQKAADSLNDHAKDCSDSISGSLQTVNDRLDRIEDTADAYLDQLNHRSQTRLDEMNSHLEEMNQQISDMTLGAAGGNDELHATTTAIIGQLDQARRAVKDLVEGLERTVEDTSQEELTGPGLVSGCQNTGTIQGDANTGGIAGIAAPELDSDPELDISLKTEDILVDTLVTLTATLQRCENRGDILAKNGCAGGILGRGEVGAVLGCTSYGPVSASNGGQCGGIAGLSKGTIRACAAQADLSGEDELGGIAGWGNDILDCTAMTRILEGGERTGAIAGWAEGTVSHCFYLREDVAGVDGIDYTGRAAGLSWEEFSALEGVPADFLEFWVTFQADGKTVLRTAVPYGGRMEPEEFPDVPQLAGTYGQWSGFDYTHITRSVTVEALYSDWVTTISSGGERPLLLAQGTFAPSAQLTLSQREDLVGTVFEGNTVAAAFDYKLTDEAFQPGQITLRVLTDGAGEHAQAGLYQDGAITLIEAQADGSYLVFTGESQGTLVLLAQPGGSGPLAAILCAAGGALALLLILRRLRSGKKKPVPAAAVTVEATSEVAAEATSKAVAEKES